MEELLVVRDVRCRDARTRIALLLSAGDEVARVLLCLSVGYDCIPFEYI